MVAGRVLRRVHVVKDLGVPLDDKLFFRPHVDQIVAWAKSTLGLVKRMAKGFDSPYVTKSVYTFVMRPIMEYASVVWSPFLVTDITRIESVQKQFLLFAFRDLGWALRLLLPPY